MMRLIMRMLRSDGVGDFAYHLSFVCFCWVCAHLVSHTWGESEAFHTGTDGLGWIGGRSMGQEHDMSV